MASVLIRDIPDEVVAQLKSTAKRNKRSLQKELRAELENSVIRSSPDVFRKASKIRNSLRKRGIRFSDSARILRTDRGR